MATRQQQKGIQYEDLVPKSEWKDQPEATILTIDLPGFAKEQIKVTYVHTSKMIRVMGERPLADRRWSRFNEVFSVPQNCIVDKIHGSFKNNVLTITIPKETITKMANLPEASKTEAAALEKRLLEESRRKEKEEEEAKQKKKQLLEEKEEIIKKLQEEAKAKETEMRKLQEEAKAKEDAEARKLQEEVEAEEKLEKKKKKLVEEVKEKLEKNKLEELKLAKEAKENLEKKKLEGLKRVEDVKERLEKKKLEGLKLVEEAKEKHEKKKKLVEEAKQKKIHETKNVDESRGKEQILKLEERKLPEVVYTKSGSGSSGTKAESSETKSRTMGVGEVVKKAEEKLGNLVEKEKKMGKGIIEKIRRKETTSEEKKLMINVGVAALVIFALGAYVSYAFCSSSSSSSSSPPPSSSSTKPE